jgi:DNA invertase Pin-like site-specific DNA recombinase
MLIGYARVSTHDQSLDLQLDAFKKADCDRVFTDTISGVATNRPGLNEALEFMRPGDTLVVWQLDRLGRSLIELIQTVSGFKVRGILFKSLEESFIDTTTDNGELIFQIFGSLSEYERKLIRKRTNAGLAAARARGRLGGRPKIETLDPKKIELAKKLYHSRVTPVKEICKQLGIGRTTLYRYVGMGKEGVTPQSLSL